ncbi:MAG: hypothetical protein KAT06_11715 [Gammaproteobacteria bacterium]|nr:hypothetical protein [Gammaproteobacteria bacterium]
MGISSVSNASFSRPVTQSKSSSDRQSSARAQADIVENKAQERAQEQRAVQQRLQHHKEESQRRLDGRLISFGQEQDNISSQQKQASFNRSRVNEAYAPPRQNEITYSQNEQAERARDRVRNQNNEAIDIVV